MGLDAASDRTAVSPPRSRSGLDEVPEARYLASGQRRISAEEGRRSIADERLDLVENRRGDWIRLVAEDLGDPLQRTNACGRDGRMNEVERPSTDDRPLDDRRPLDCLREPRPPTCHPGLPHHRPREITAPPFTRRLPHVTPRRISVAAEPGYPELPTPAAGDVSHPSDRRTDSAGERRRGTVTPEVAGSSPVAPARREPPRSPGGGRRDSPEEWGPTHQVKYSGRLT